MNREDIIKMTREAHLDVYGLGKSYEAFASALERFAYLVAVAEREACAQVCDDWPNGRDDVYLIGKAIRARGEK